MAEEEKTAKPVPATPATKAEVAVAIEAPKPKKATKVKSISDVKKLAKYLSEVLPAGSVVNVPISMEEYNDFLDKFEKPATKEEGRGFRAPEPISTSYVQSFEEKGITINIEGKL